MLLLDHQLRHLFLRAAFYQRDKLRLGVYLLRDHGCAVYAGCCADDDLGEELAEAL